MFHHVVPPLKKHEQHHADNRDLRLCRRVPRWLPRARPQGSVRDMAAALEKLKGIEVTTLQQLRDVLKAGCINDF